jgi:hypothetical protein
VEPETSTRWYFATFEERQAWMRERYQLARAANASPGCLATLKKGALSVLGAPESSQPS